MSSSLRQRYEILLRILREEKQVLVAFSGGCDSTFLVAAARKTLGRPHVLAVTAVSASLPLKENEAIQKLADALDVRRLSMETSELQNPAYASNPTNRCFFCKDELFGKLAPIAEENKMTLLDGFNASDRTDYRPGFQAAMKWNVRHPLDEADLTKRDIRLLSRWMGLPTWNKPASPCLSSRIPYGTPVSEKILRQIENAEEVVRAEGFRIVRVRHYGREARIEVPQAEVSRLLHPERWARVIRGLNACGYDQVTADPRGFQSGRLNSPDARPAVKSF